MPSLNRLILINTHLAGVVELVVDDHTNICGTNASGKTTLQRLVPGVERVLSVSMRRFHALSGPSLVTVTIAPEDVPLSVVEKVSRSSRRPA